MANWTHIITAVDREPGGFNVVVDITYTDDSDPPRTFVDRRWPLGTVPVDRVEAIVDEQARKRIRNMLTPGDATLEKALTLVGKVRTLPSDPPQPDPAKQAAAQAAMKEFQLAQVKAANNQDLLDKFNAMQAAMAAAAILS